MIGCVLGGRYEIVEAVDSGGMAYVYKALCKKTKAHVAVKVLKEKFCTHAEYIARFKKEAEAAFSLEHENIVRVKDIGCDNGVYYMVMDYIDGVPLKKLIERRRVIGEKDAVLYAAQVCAALSAAHKRGIIHRDIKPQNILIDKIGDAKLTDFGIAKSLAVAQPDTETQVIGSVYYVSPEQARGDAVDARTDIYSLGIVLYEMLTGELPHTGEQTVSVALKHINEKITAPASLNPALSAAVNNIVLKATSKNRRDRYRSADAFREDLLRALADPDGAFVDMPAVYRARAGAGPKILRRHKILKICILAALICALSAGALLGASLFVNPAQKTLTVPDMAGQDVEYASTVLGRMGFAVELSYASSETAAAGTVISQTPAAGSDAPHGAALSLTVSTGPADLIMPDLFGWSVDEARAFIEDMGLVVAETVYEMRDDAPVSTVVSHMPAADTVVEEGETVVLVVAADEEPDGVAMPQLADLSVHQAVSLLHGLGFTTCFVYEEDSERPEGTVIEQSQGQGVQTAPATQIDLWISAFKAKPYRAGVNVTLDIPEKDSRVKMVLETHIEGTPVSFVVYETQVAQIGELTIFRDIRDMWGGVKKVRVFVNNIETYVSEVTFVRTN